VIITTNHPTDPYWSDETAALYVGDARQLLAEMPDGSVDCLVTSPPYWAKRDYRVPGQYGHEPTPAAYADTLRATFAEARRVLADDGTCWLNIGDSYGQGWTGTSPAPTRPKDLLGLPWRVAFALQDDGWMIRNAIVWHKPNAMPESVRDRLNCRYEMIFLLVKSRRYWFDLDPIRLPCHDSTHRHPTAPDTTHTRARRHATHPERLPHCDAPPKYGAHAAELLASGRRFGVKMRPKDQHHKAAHPNGRNPGDVWSIPTRPYKGPHFAAFPIDLPERCIAAGCRPGGTVADPFCGIGTTGLAAKALGRRFVGIELSHEFATLAARRLGAAGIGRKEGDHDAQ
jgi:DNA modification methylase